MICKRRDEFTLPTESRPSQPETVTKQQHKLRICNVMELSFLVLYCFTITVHKMKWDLKVIL